MSTFLENGAFDAIRSYSSHGLIVLVQVMVRVFGCEYRNSRGRYAKDKCFCARTCFCTVIFTWKKKFSFYTLQDSLSVLNPRCNCFLWKEKYYIFFLIMDCSHSRGWITKCLADGTSVSTGVAWLSTLMVIQILFTRSYTVIGYLG